MNDQRTYRSAWRSFTWTVGADFFARASRSRHRPHGYLPAARSFAYLRARRFLAICANMRRHAVATFSLSAARVSMRIRRAIFAWGVIDGERSATCLWPSAPLASLPRYQLFSRTAAAPHTFRAAHTTLTMFVHRQRDIGGRLSKALPAANKRYRQATTFCLSCRGGLVHQGAGVKA